MFSQLKIIFIENNNLTLIWDALVPRESDKKKVLLGLGGGHYAPRHMDIVR